MAKKIAFISTHEHYINRNLFQKFVEYFVDFEVVFFDLVKLIKSRKGIVLINSIYVIFEYGIELLLKRKKLVECFFRTSFIYSKINEIICETIDSDDYVFTFQTNSIFDTNTLKLPHFVYTDHTHLTNLTYPSFDKKRIFPEKWIQREKQIYKNSTMVFTYSKNIERSIINDYECEPYKVACVFAGSNLNKTNILPLNNENYNNKNIIFVGVDWVRKGGPDLLKAFKEILKSISDAKLTIVGSSPEINIPNCNVVGRVNLEELYQHYSEASIFCLPTKLEPFGIVFLEAMLNKLPIVATKIGAIPDLVQDGKNGYLIEPGNVTQLKDALTKLLLDPDACKQFGEYGYKHVLEHYAWDKVVQKLKEKITPHLITIN